MRNLFQSKNHKKEESIRLQKQLQREEERLFKIEQAKRKIIQTRDEEFARRLQQQLQLEEQQSSSPRVVPSPEQQRPQQHSQLSRQQESLTDEEFARILQEQLDAEEFQEQSRSPPPAPPARQQEVRHTISDEEYARQLQEQFELEEREFQHNQQLRQPGSPHQQQQYTMPVPALPPRNSGYTTERQMPLPSLPAKPAATTTWNQNLGEQYQQLLLSSSTASPSVQHASAGDSIQPYPPLQAPSSPSSYHAPQQLPSPERHQQSQQQSYEVNNSGVSLYPNSSSSSPVPTHQQVSLPYQQQYQPQPHVPGSPLTVVTAFPQNNQVSSCHPNVAPQPYNQSIYPQGIGKSPVPGTR
ncbi:hypothetical protein BX666DRAFT_1110034 [Dichotomocladium elegans]|nr:hypothetical protein BX666DRAFT_1110034 [Dichotomocladium elegans]